MSAVASLRRQNNGLGGTSWDQSANPPKMHRELPVEASVAEERAVTRKCFCPGGDATAISVPETGCLFLCLLEVKKSRASM